MTELATQSVARYEDLKNYPKQMGPIYLMENDVQSMEQTLLGLDYILTPLNEESVDVLDEFVIRLTGFLTTSAFGFNHDKEIQAAQISTWTSELKHLPFWAIVKGFKSSKAKYAGKQPETEFVKRFAEEHIKPFIQKRYSIQNVLNIARKFKTREDYEAHLKAEKEAAQKREAAQTAKVIKEAKKTLENIDQKAKGFLEQQNKAYAKQNKSNNEDVQRKQRVANIIETQARFNGLSKEIDAVLKQIAELCELKNELDHLYTAGAQNREP